MAVASGGRSTPGPVPRLIARWAEAGLPLRPGCSAGVLDAFEAHAGRRLPADLRTFLGSANGVDWDDGFAFLPLEAYEPFDQVAGRHGQGCPGVADPGSYYVFCDYLHWSWGYAIRLSRPGDADGGNEVIPIGMTTTFVIASSFSEFVDLYLADSPRLYPPD